MPLLLSSNPRPLRVTMQRIPRSSDVQRNGPTLIDRP